MKCLKCDGELFPVKVGGKSYAKCDKCDSLFTANDLKNYMTNIQNPPPQERKNNLGLKIGLIAGIALIIVIAATIIFALNAGLFGSKKTKDLTGTWKSQNNNGSYQEAIITEDTIKINWISDNGKTKSIYWIGTFAAPSEPASEYSWTSKKDKNETDAALFASTDDTKDFTYKNGIISYEVSALGSTTILELKKQ